MLVDQMVVSSKFPIFLEYKNECNSFCFSFRAIISSFPLINLEGKIVEQHEKKKPDLYSKIMTKFEAFRSNVSSSINLVFCHQSILVLEKETF